jgi:hypothetical protein
VEGLIKSEGLKPSQILLVINGEGGLLDQALETSIHVHRLPENVGPAGGFAEGMRFARNRLGAEWLYLCEDDIGLLDLPTPRLAHLIQMAEEQPNLGAVVAYGRDLKRRTGVTVPHRLIGSTPHEDVDLAAWGASLINAKVLDAGVQPDPALFFGYEDFDFWLRLRASGFRIVVDTAAALQVGGAVSGEGREAAFRGQRPGDFVEPWRRYYEARNFFHLRRVHGTPMWTLSHLVKSARRFQIGPTSEHRRCLVAGLRDGWLGRTGRNDRYQRSIGEMHA